MADAVNGADLQEQPKPAESEAERKARHETRRQARIQKIVLAVGTMVERTGAQDTVMLQQTQLALMAELNAIWAILFVCNVCDEEDKQNALDAGVTDLLNRIVSMSQKLVTPDKRIVM